MEATLKQMEENFEMEKRGLQDLNRYQSRIDQMEDKLQESTREVHEDRREVESKKPAPEESCCIQQEESASRLSPMEALHVDEKSGDGGKS